MENKKLVTFSFLAFSLLAGFVLSIILGLASAIATGSATRIIQGDFVQHIVPVVFGVVVFAVLQFRAVTRNWGEDVISELKKVVWPSRKDTTRMTIVVSVMVVIAGLFLFLVDQASSWVIKMIVEKVNF